MQEETATVCTGMSISYVTENVILTTQETDRGSTEKVTKRRGTWMRERWQTAEEIGGGRLVLLRGISCA